MRSFHHVSIGGIGTYHGFFSIGVGARMSRAGALGMMLRDFCPGTRVRCAAGKDIPAMRSTVCGRPFTLSNRVSIGTTTFGSKGVLNGIDKGGLCNGLVDNGDFAIAPPVKTTGNSVFNRGSILNASVDAFKLAGNGHNGVTSVAP